MVKRPTPRKCRRAIRPQTSRRPQNIPRHTAARSHHLTTRLRLTGRCDAVEPQEDGSTRIIECKATPVRRNASVTPAHRVRSPSKILPRRSRRNHQRMRGALHQPQQNRARRYLRRNIRTAKKNTYTPPAHSSTTRQHRNPSKTHPRSWCSPHLRVPTDRSHGKKHYTRRRQQPRQPSSAPLRARIRRPSSKGASSCNTSVKQSAAYPSNVCTASWSTETSTFPPLLRELMWRNCTIIWCSSTSRVSAGRNPAPDRMDWPRVQQHVLSAQGHLPIAAAMIASKITKPSDPAAP